MIKLFLQILLFFSLSLSLWGQEGETYLSQKSIEIGENITLIYRIRLNQGVPVSYQPEKPFLKAQKITENHQLSDAGKAIEVTQPFYDTIIQSATGKEWIGTYIITCWDEGTFSIQGPAAKINGQIITFPSAMLECKLAPAQKGLDMYDIRESFTQLPEQPLSEQVKDFLSGNWWWLTLIIVVIGAFIVYTRYKNRKETPQQSAPEISLLDKTLREIDRLEQERLWEKSGFKAHFSELSFLLRNFLSAYYEINLLEKTTNESSMLLKQLGLPENTVKEIAEVLSAADMVKFAKSQPGEQDVIHLLQLTSKLVVNAQPIHQKHVE